MEVKRNSYELKGKIEKIINKKNTFIQAYNNIIYDKLSPEKNDNFELIFICNKSRGKIVKNCINFKINNSVLYSNQNISLNVISFLNSNVCELNIKNNILKNDIDLLKLNEDKQGKLIQNLVKDKDELAKQIKDIEDYKKTTEEQMKNHEDMIKSLSKK